jgi:Cof subfamily protein (haloacid dehalogenase superfamily)
MQNDLATPTDTLENALCDARTDIRLLVLDIDGTIAGDSNQVNPAVLEAIQAVQAQGIGVAIATGRMYQSALRFHQQVGSKLPLICYQGALIQDPKTQTVHRHCSVPPESAQALLDYFTQLELDTEISVHMYVDDQLYVAEMNELTLDYAQRSQITPNVVPDLSAIAQRSPTKVLALSDSPALITQLLNDLRQQFSPAELYLTRSVPTFFEAAHPLVNKGAAVQYLAEEVLKLNASQVMAIGDNWNDLEMLDYAGIGIAMGSAPDAVQNIAAWVAPDVEADGVAVAIQKFLGS